MSKHIRFALGAFVLGATLLPATAFAQYTHDPYFEQTVPQSQAFGLEVIGLRLVLADKFAPPLDDELVEQIESITGADLARFNGTLKSRDPDLASSLSDALDAVQDAVGEGKDATAAVKSAQELLAKAYGTVIGAEVKDMPSFKAAVLVNLLLAENGVAEGYEEAVENREPWEYPNGWAALQRVKALWTDIKPLGKEQRQTDGQEMVDALDLLFPDAGPPESVAGWNPEEAESPAQRLAGIIEEVADANLYPDRDLPRLAGHLSDVTAQACTDYAVGNDEIAMESLYAAFDHYQSHLYDTAGLFAPEVRQNISQLFGSLIAIDDDDDDDEAASAESTSQTSVAADSDDQVGAATDDDDDDDSAENAIAPAAACGELQKAFVELETAFAG